ncbi:MAG: nitrous oxide reductase accessory protein NosL [Rhodospirillales bacterium]|nr:nitrous oxide reductase accessory protein NosL [Rhodospirillales bacterium]
MKVVALALACLTLLAGCGEDQQAAAPPPPAALTREAVGHYCGMVVVDHPGPKAQIFVADTPEPYWFTSVRDAIAFTLLPEEPRNITAFYVTDMGKSADWDNPQTWMPARDAVFVIGSARRGGMGQMEVVPFSERAAAERFIERNGGRVVTQAEIPQDYVLGEDQEGAGATHGGAGH